MSTARLASSLFIVAAAAAGCFSDPPIDTTTTGTTGTTGTTAATSADTSSGAGDATSSADTTAGEAEDTSADEGSTSRSSSDQGDSTTEAEPLDHLVFVTSEQYRGNLMGLAGADAQCEFLASLAGLEHGRAWRAILSDANSHVNTRVTISAPVRNVVGDLVAANAVSFWNEDLGAELLTEYGELPPSWDREEQWAVTWAATPSSSCQDWQSGTVASLGDIAVTISGLWIFGGGADRPCSNALPYLCISQ